MLSALNFTYTAVILKHDHPIDHTIMALFAGETALINNGQMHAAKLIEWFVKWKKANNADKSEALLTQER